MPLSTSLRRIDVVLRNSLLGFVQDLADHSAERISSPNWAVDGLTTVGIAVLAASAQAEAVQKLVSQLVGDLSLVVQLFLLLGAILWCVAVISGKTPSKLTAGVVAGANSKREYSYAYSQPVRIAAKIGLIIFVVAFPIKLKAIMEEALPLPSTIYGYLLYDTTKPVDGAHVRVVSADGSDITVGIWVSDSNGFYIIKARRAMRRSDVLKVMPDDCADEVSLSLTKSNEIPSRNSDDRNDAMLSPLFRHRIHCSGSK
jgi:hypothetical protein